LKRLSPTRGAAWPVYLRFSDGPGFTRHPVDNGSIDLALPWVIPFPGKRIAGHLDVSREIKLVAQRGAHERFDLPPSLCVAALVGDGGLLSPEGMRNRRVAFHPALVSEDLRETDVAEREFVLAFAAS
jgi:hypothetical protein